MWIKLLILSRNFRCWESEVSFSLFGSICLRSKGKLLKMLSESKCFGWRDKESRWWNKDIDKVNNEKMKCFKFLYKCNNINIENWTKYHNNIGN